MTGSPSDPWALVNIGSTAVGCLLVPMGLGWLVDTLLGTFPGLLLAGLALGIVSCAIYTYREVRKFVGS